jgi:hypothetical protein
MKVTLEIPDGHIDNALTDPHSRHWCSELIWSGGYGKCVERDGKVIHTLDSARIEKAIQLMAAQGRPELANVLGDSTDGPDRDVFLQYIVFGGLKYS